MPSPGQVRPPGTPGIRAGGLGPNGDEAGFAGIAPGSVRPAEADRTKTIDAVEAGAAHARAADQAK
jgi:hypothetical protein